MKVSNRGNYIINKVQNSKQQSIEYNIPTVVQACSFSKKNYILIQQLLQSPSTSTKHYFNTTVVLNHHFNQTAVSTTVFLTVLPNICFHPSVDQS